MASNWAEFKDPQSGRTYYANSLTKAVTWKMPPEYLGSLPPEKRLEYKEQEVKSLKDKIEKLKQALESAESNRRLTELTLTNVQSDCESAEAKVTQYEKEKLVYEQKLSQLQHQPQQQQALRQFELALNAEKNRSQQLEASINIEKSRVSTLEAQLHSERQKHMTDKLQDETKEREKLNLISQVNTLQGQLYQLQQNIDSIGKDRSAVERKVTDLEKQCKELNNTNEQLNARYSLLITQSQTREKELMDELQKARSGGHDLSSTKSQLLQEQQNVSRLTLQLNKLQIDYNALSASDRDSSQRFLLAQQETDGLRKERDDLQHRLETKDYEYNELEKRFQSLSSSSYIPTTPASPSPLPPQSPAPTPPMGSVVHRASTFSPPGVSRPISQPLPDRPGSKPRAASTLPGALPPHFASTFSSTAPSSSSSFPSVYQENKEVADPSVIQPSSVPSSPAGTQPQLFTQLPATVQSPPPPLPSLPVFSAEQLDEARKWRSVVDPKSGKEYYYNEITRQTSWAKPLAFDEAHGLVQPQSQVSVPSSQSFQQSQLPRGGRQSIGNLYNPSFSRLPSGYSTDGSDGSRVDGSPQSENSDSSSSSSMGSTTYYESRPGMRGSVAVYLPNNDGLHGAGSSLPVEQQEEDFQGMASLMQHQSMSSIVQQEDSNVGGLMNLERRSSRSEVSEQKKRVRHTIINIKSQTKIQPFDFGAVTQYSFTNYAKDNFLASKKGGKTSDILTYTTYSPKLIKAPLTKLATTLHPDAVQTFKNIMSYMGDRKTGKGPRGHVQKLLRRGMDGPPEIRDEIYCQLMKQTNQNPKESLNRGWTLIALCSGTFPPSKAFAPYFLVYLHIGKGNRGNAHIEQMAKVASMLVTQTLNNGPRLTLPNNEEILAVEEKRSIPTKIHCVDDSEITCAVSSQTTVMDIVTTLLKELTLPPESCTLELLTLNHGKRYSSTPLHGALRILDVLDNWQQQKIAKEKDKAKQGQTMNLDFRLLFQTSVFIIDDIDLTHPDTLHHYFIQAVYDVMMGNYITEETEAIQLAAAHMQAYFGDEGPPQDTPMADLKNYFQFSLLRKTKAERLWPLLQKEREGIKGSNKEEAKRLYMMIIRKNKDYGTRFFKVMTTSSSKNEEMLLGINEKGISYLHCQTRVPIRPTLSMKLVKKMEASDSALWLTHDVIGGQAKRVQYYSNMARWIKQLIDKYYDETGVLTS